MPGERVNQKERTRQAIVQAGIDLMRAGRAPTIAEVADAAKVSVATAYRYFPNPQALWVEANRTGFAWREPEEVFAGAGDPTARVEALIKAIGWTQYDEEALWRTALRALLTSGPAADATLERTGQRMRWIDEALDPLDGRFPDDVRRRLKMALALVFGTESIVTLRDVCGLDADEARAVSMWAAKALVRAAEAEAESPRWAQERPGGTGPDFV
jgi:AcrR family transcriptional regulator